ncbi:phosphotransferase [Streptomyces sp. NPDC020875]|uniref:phosphotransferase n=1 Tax=Streptomyces sp. NPDC020875 TaxID=3154898 RepID=UPI0033CF413C
MNPQSLAPTDRQLDIPPVLRYGRDRILDAAAAQWPGSTIRIRGYVPSATSCVLRIAVGNTPFVAKLSLLGVSVSSVLRGTHGAWPEVLAAQEQYESGAGHLMERQALQYGLLASAGLGDSQPVVRDGVLFTRELPGRPLGAVVAQYPARTSRLLRGALRELNILTARPEALVLARAAGTPDATISAVFERKFGQSQRSDELLEQAVIRLRELAAGLDSPDVAVFGDLKPEHVLVGRDRYAFIDPALSVGSPVLDVAKLVSRLVLYLAVVPSSNPCRAMAGIDEAVAEWARHTAPGPHGGGRLWQLVLAWAMDTANILHTVRTAPAMMPLPGHLHGLLGVDHRVVLMLDRIARALEQNGDGGRAWATALSHTDQVLAR